MSALAAPRRSSRRTALLTIVLVIGAALLAAGLFIAGAMWRARITAGVTATP
jgi:hypothetical protein